MPFLGSVGSQVGTQQGDTLGSAVGGASSSVALWTSDATSGKAIPQNSTEWAAVLAAAGVASGGPSAIWRLQDSSGNPADVLGAFPLTATGAAAAYSQSVSGWSSKGIAFTDALSANFQSTSASLPDVSTASCLLLFYATIPTNPAAARQLIQLGTGSTHDVEYLILGAGNSFKAETKNGANTALGAATTVGAVRPIGVRLNITATTCTGWNDVDKMAPAYDALTTGKRIAFGGVNSTAPASTFVYGAMFTGVAAEMSDGQLKSVLQTMGWSIAWS